MSNPDNIFKDKLFDLETPLGGDVSFEKVMAMRGQNKGPVWWKPALLVISTLSIVSATGYFAFQNYAQGEVGAGKKAVLAQADSKSTKSHGSGAVNNSQQAMDNSKVLVQRNTRTETIGQGSQSSHNFGGVQDRQAHGGQQTVTDAAVAENANATFQIPDFSEIAFFGVRTNEINYTWKVYTKKLEQKDKSDGKPKNMPYLELMMATGGNRVADFQAQSAYSIRGTHRFAQYSAIGLWSVAEGFQLGAGFSFGQFAGFGELRTANQYYQQHVDTNTVIIVQPGLPDKTVTTYDTSNILVTDVKTGEINYRMSKMSIPIGFRYYIGEGQTLFRLSATVSPGLLTTTTGSVFNRNTAMELAGQTQRSMTLDARLGAGAYFTLSQRTALLIEPGISYQSVLGSVWGPYNRVQLGMGFGLMIKL